MRREEYEIVYDRDRHRWLVQKYNIIFNEIDILKKCLTVKEAEDHVKYLVESYRRKD